MMTPRRYDWNLKIDSRGREPRFRARQIAAARLAPGESVLDLGCGTGTTAIAAAKAVGPKGRVCAVDPALELLAHAQKKARRAGVNVEFLTADGQRLPFDDASFDAVLCTLVFHHLDGPAMHQTIGEIRRVLKPGGRLLAVDIGGRQDPERKTFHGHTDFDLDRFIPRLPKAGFRLLDNGPIESELRSLEKLTYFLAELE
jgi:ubiquinone/menaquinone biosynthesis C-methylase UbiE